MARVGLRRAATVALIGGGLVAAFGQGAISAVGIAEAVLNLDGNWSGSGSINFTNGERQRVKCRATSNVAAGQARQSLHCASPSSQINVHVTFLTNGNDLRGSWSESRSGTKGSLTGDVNGKSITLKLRGSDFKGTMRLAAAGCSQSVVFQGQGAKLQSANIQLRKC